MRITTNIVMSYPVRWTEYGIASNYVQNFVDALGPERFGGEFRCSLEEKSIVLSAGVDFAVEWLYYLGASTKREKQSENAGGFGEGFKIAALCSLRDFQLEVRMQSRDWDLSVTTAPGNIAGKEVSLLAYEVNPRPYEKNAVLTLTGKEPKVLKELYERILMVKQDFFYQGNPTLGRCLYGGYHMAVYQSAAMGGKGKPYGRLFARRQVRADFLGPPLIFRHDTYDRDEDDRDRKDFHFSDTRQCVQQILSVLPAANAYEILLCIQDFWYIPRARGFHNDDWSFLLTGLLERIGSSGECRERFLREFPSCLALPGKSWSAFERKQAMEWYQVKAVKKIRRLVHQSFHAFLGVEDVCELCRENGGLAAERDPVGTELRQIEILEEAAEVFLKGIMCLSLFPPVKVITAKNSILNGCAYEWKVKGEKTVNDYGLSVTARAAFICLREKLFQGSFYEAFPVFAHEILHQFGGDSSAPFREALRLMNRSLYLQGEKCADFARRWEEVRGKEEGSAQQT